MISPAAAAVPSQNPAHSMTKRIRVCSYTAQYPVRWITESALHFTPLSNLFIPTLKRSRVVFIKGCRLLKGKGMFLSS